MLADAARRQVHHLQQRRFELGFVDLAGAVQVDVDRQRLGDADRVGDLDRAAIGEAGGDDVLGQIARGVGGRAVDLGRVLAGEGAAAVRRRAAVGVDDDLAAGEAAVAVRAADDELAGRVDVPDGLARDPAVGQRLEDIGARRSRATSSDERLRRDAGARRRSASPRPACRSRSARVTWLLASGPSAGSLAGVARLGDRSSGSCGRSGAAPASAPASRRRRSRT